MFVRNCWYVAAWGHEVSAQPVGFVLLNEPVVLFRLSDGTAVALEDRCAHRRLPLSKGRVVSDRIVCAYHGLAYDCTGQCIHVPGQAVPVGLRVKSYLTVERYGCIWIWMGDQERADPSSTFDLHSADDPGWGARNRLFVKANYQLVNDNLCDLSHLGYLHASNVGTPDLAEFAEVETAVNGNSVQVSRWTLNKPPPTTYKSAGGFDGNIDRWQISEFSPPGFFKLSFGAVPTGLGRAGKNSPKRFAFQVFQWVTPETEKTTHWFWAIAHDFGPQTDRSSAPPFYQQVSTIVGEDFAAIEAQQLSIDRDPAAPNGKIDADSGVLEARRIITRLLNEEAKHQPATSYATA